jgi:hypothetical protein
MEIPKDLLDDIKSYCSANNITDIDKYIIKILKQGHLVEKFGSTPFSKEPEVIIKEVFIDKTKKQTTKTKKGDTKKKVTTPKEKNVKIDKKDNIDKTDLYGE